MMVSQIHFHTKLDVSITISHLFSDLSSLLLQFLTFVPVGGRNILLIYFGTNKA